MDPLKILLVDDSKSARYALRLQLQRHGVDVDIADSAESALQKIEEQPPDAVLMDHTMPGMNGFEALEILKANQATAGIPVVMCTSHEEPTYNTQARNKGALAILPKSSAPQKLPGVLDEIHAALAAAHISAAPQAAEAEEPLTVSADTLLPGVTEMEEVPLALATPEGLSKQDIETLIDIRVEQRLERLERQLDARVDSILDALLGTRLEQTLPGRLDVAIEPKLAQLKQGLTDALSASLDGRVDARMAAQQEQKGSKTDEIGRERIQRATTELLAELLPAMLERQISANPAPIVDLVERRVRAIDQARNEEPSVLTRVLAEVDPVIDARAADVAKKEAQTAVNAALRQLASAAETRTESAKQPAAGSNLAAIGAAVGAAVVGIGAAATVYFLLS